MADMDLVMRLFAAVLYCMKVEYKCQRNNSEGCFKNNFTNNYFLTQEKE